VLKKAEGVYASRRFVVGRAGRVVLFVWAAAAVAGCTESVRQYTRLGGWTQPADEPVILSGNRARDAAAHRASSEHLSEADWQVLERIAPRPVWERIEAARRRLHGETDQPQITSRVVSDRQAPGEAPREVPTQTLPDGTIQFFYELRHYGGAAVTSKRDGGTARRRITLKHADLRPIVDLLTRHLGEKGTVAALPSENRIVVTCQPEMKAAVLKMLDAVDVPGRQVEITARIFEVNHDFDFQIGVKTLINHIASDNTQALAGSFSAKDFAGAVVDPASGTVPDPGAALQIMNIFSKAGVRLDATFQALADTGLIRVVSSPRMAVRAGETAYMLAGQELPIQSAKVSNDKLLTEKIQYKPVGVQLHITPQIIGPRDIKLHVVTTVTAISGFAPVPSLDRNATTTVTTNPILDSREAETFVSVRDGQTLVIGGLRMVRTITREQKVPGLGDLALLEWLFKNHRSQKLADDLYFFVTPRILEQDG
jgi:type II secretory pathway component GspD/PulD (secretin)